MKLKERLNNLIKYIKTEKFLNNKGLANEVPFYIFDYDPSEEIYVRDFIKDTFTKKFTDSKDINLKVVDLFELIMEAMKVEDIEEGVFDKEERKGSVKNLEFLKSSIEDYTHKAFFKKIDSELIGNEEKMKTIICITGVGSAYPVIQPKELLGKLEDIFNYTKIILFLPGNYDKQYITTLNKFKIDHYRAMKLTGEL